METVNGNRTGVHVHILTGQSFQKWTRSLVDVRHEYHWDPMSSSRGRRCLQESRRSIYSELRINHASHPDKTYVKTIPILYTKDYPQFLTWKYSTRTYQPTKRWCLSKTLWWVFRTQGKALNAETATARFVATPIASIESWLTSRWRKVSTTLRMSQQHPERAHPLWIPPRCFNGASERKS